jgi:hypothetical protein
VRPRVAGSDAADTQAVFSSIETAARQTHTH